MEDKRGLFAKIFIALMIFTALVWVWTVAFIISWPWEKNAEWKPEFRVVAVEKEGLLEQTNVVEQYIQVFGVAAFAAAAPVTLVVKTEYGNPLPVEPGCQVAVATDVFALAVYERNHRPGFFHRPFCGKKIDPLGVFPI